MVNFYFDKMAERGSEDLSNFRGMRRVRVLVEAIEDFRRRRERGQISPSPPTMVQRGRAGAPGVIRRMVERHLGEVSMCNLKEEELEVGAFLQTPHPIQVGEVGPEL